MTEAKRKELMELLESDMSVRREFLGLQTQLAPFPQHCSCQRLMMYASHCAQSMVLNNAEPPRIFTGMENVVGQYQFTKTRRDQDVHVLGIVPKFCPTNWKHGDDMPSYTVVYRGNKDGKINYFELDRYTFLHDGFGYINDRPDIDTVSFESDIPKEAVLTRSPAWRTGDYGMGLNANVVYLTDPAVTEDAFVISESFAKRCTNLAIKQIKLNLRLDDVLLNLYGDRDTDEYKVMPDIGETVREDGVLVAIRTKNAASYVSDMTMDALQRIEPLHDELHKAPPGAKVLDVDVFINFDQLKRLRDNDTVYNQLLKIHRDHMYYYNEILRLYSEFVERGEIISDEFNTLVLRCMELSNNRKYVKRSLKLCDLREPIEFITFSVTYAYEREISVGSKLTDRCGGKGVVSEIRPDDFMPVDANGFRADIIMTPPSIINRMNPSQLYEQFWNRCSDQVVRNAKAANMSWKAAYKYFIEFCKDFRENYGRALDEYILENEQMKREWTEANLARGYIRLLAAWTKGKPYGYLDKMAKKYGVEETPVSYLFTDEETGETTRITTIEPAMIGSKYLMYLGKIPDETLTTVEAAYVNQFETPIKLGSKRIKDQSLVGLTPQKFGEDEICMLTMSLGDEPVARMACVHSAAPSVTKELFVKMLTVNHPTQFMALDMSTQDVISQNRNVLIFADMMGAIGYDVHSQANKDQP